MIKYDKKSLKAEEFINDGEIKETLEYAKNNKSNKELIFSIIEKARSYKGLSHREAAVLLECDIPEANEAMKELAYEIKEKIYGHRIVMFAPLYLSNYCVNGCTYCPYHAVNKHIPRKKLSQEEIKKEVIALQDMGHKRLAIESGEDPVNNPIEYILESIKTIYSIHHKNGDIRRVNVNIAATTVENYRKLKEAGIGTYILFQETYNKEDYEMYSMDFEEFLWAKSYSTEQIEEYYKHLLEIKPLSDTEYNVMLANFREYIVIGGMPAIVNQFVTNNNYSGTLKMQRQILLDYEEDITKYAKGLDKGKILNIYRKIPVFLGKENKKFQILLHLV